MENILDGEEMLKRLVDMDMGEVRIGASDMTLQFYLLPYLETFHERYPNIKVMVSNAPTPETIESLYEGKIDFGVVSTPFDARPEVEAFEGEEDPEYLCRRKQVLDAEGKADGVRGTGASALYFP